MTDQRESRTPGNDDWAPCAPGTFQSVKQATRSTGSSAGLKPYAIGLCLGLLLALAAVGVKSMAPQPDSQQTLACSEVQPLLVAYAAEQLDDDVATQVREHLEICGHCRAQFEALASDSYRAILRDGPRRHHPALVAMVQ